MVDVPGPRTPRAGRCQAVVVRTDRVESGRHRVAEWIERLVTKETAFKLTKNSRLACNRSASWWRGRGLAPNNKYPTV